MSKLQRQSDLLKRLFDAATVERKAFIKWEQAKLALDAVKDAALGWECHPADVDEEIQKAKTQYEQPTVDSNIAILDLRSRTYHALWNGNIETIGQLIQYTPGEVQKFRGLGMFSVVEISSALARCGFKLKDSHANLIT